MRKIDIKNFFILVLISFGAFSCSGYFNENRDSNAHGAVDSLALADGSGFLSTDTFNEITPFLYHDTNNGKKFLFFSSDRNGTYDLYFAEMDAQGKFLNLNQMAPNVNTSEAEFSPVIFHQWNQLGDMLFTFISFIRVSNSTITQVVTMAITNLTNMTGSIVLPLINTNSNIVRLGLLINGSSDRLVLSTGSQYFTYELEWDSTGMTWAYFSSNATVPATLPIYNSFGLFYSQFYTIGFDNYFSEGYFHVLDCLVAGRHQLYYALDWYMPTLTLFGPITPFGSGHNDKDPVIDTNTMRVYFSSDRYRKTNYDLYRYNLLSIDAMGLIPPAVINN